MDLLRWVTFGFLGSNSKLVFFLCGRQCEVKFKTLNQIQRWGWSSENWRFLCLRHEESIDHLLLHCETTRVLWKLIFVLFKVSWVAVRDTLLNWYDSFVNKKHKEVWQANPLCLLWIMWKAMNIIAFDNKFFYI